MRTTVTFDPDTTVAVEQFRRRTGTGVSAAVNELIRRGLSAESARPPFVQRTSSGNARIDVADVADVLDLVDGPAAS